MSKQPKKPKIGARVRFKRRNGEAAEGRVAGTDVRDNGMWVSVNVAQRGQNPELTSIRPSQLEYI